MGRLAYHMVLLDQCGPVDAIGVCFIRRRFLPIVLPRYEPDMDRYHRYRDDLITVLRWHHHPRGRQVGAKFGAPS